MAVGMFDEQFKGPEDYDLWLRVASAGEKSVTRAQCMNKATCLGNQVPGGVACAIVPLTCYRCRPGSLSHDDRKFLPQVLKVLDKAFGEGGALCGYRELRTRAMAEQYYSASWMAFLRGSRMDALRLLVRAVVWYPLVDGRHQAGLWFRYLVGGVPKVG